MLLTLLNSNCLHQIQMLQKLKKHNTKTRPRFFENLLISNDHVQELPPPCKVAPPDPCALQLPATQTVVERRLQSIFAAAFLLGNPAQGEVLPFVGVGPLLGFDVLLRLHVLLVMVLRPVRPGLHFCRVASDLVVLLPRLRVVVQVPLPQACDRVPLRPVEAELQF